jgi:hypothetical protein
MVSNVRIGYFRLAIVFFAIWAATWGSITYRSFSTLKSDQRALLVSTIYESKSSGREDHQLWEDSVSEDAAAIADDRNRLEAYSEIAIGGLVGIPLFFAAVIWVRRGFAPINSN